jgi:hypothetical protein
MSINVLVFRDKAIKELEKAQKQKALGIKNNTRSGSFFVEIQNGKGVIKFISCTYEGEIKDGKMEGKGVIRSENGHMYEGEFKANKLSGKGTYVHKNGNKYIGDFEGNKQLKSTAESAFLSHDRDRSVTIPSPSCP